MFSENLDEIAAWTEVLKLSKVSASENVCVLTGPTTNERNFRSAMMAVQTLGAKVFQLHMPALAHKKSVSEDRTSYVGFTPLTGNRAAVSALKEVEFVIDLMGLLHSQEQLEILGSGTRMLMVLEPPDILSRIVPSADDKRRVLAADRALRNAKKMHVTSAAGTDLSLPIGQFSTLPEYGFSDEPGHWDHWPSGFTSTWPDPDAGDGIVVVDAGDLLFPFKLYASAPIRLEIRKGRIESIEGGFEAEYMKEYMGSYNDPGAYCLSHVGWGLQPKAKWTALQMQHDRSKTLGMDGRSFYGNFLFSTGPNSEAGGSNHSPCHIDIPMRHCSVFLDGVPVVLDGDVIPEDQRVADLSVRRASARLAAE